MAKKSEKKISNAIETRPPVIVIMGHIDHGKSTLLDYIRKANIVEGEAGGITQHISAYEVEHSKDGVEYKITFLDTPGHSAFSMLRSHGAKAADIAVLIVSAEDGVKEQTLEAWEVIKESKIPFVVAINKIDKPEANIEKVKQSLSENNIFVEGYGGDVPSVPISAKSGKGIPELLDIILLVAELEELKGDSSKPAEGVVIEAHRDSKKGIAATLIIKDGSLKNGMHVVIGNSISPVRIMENYKGEQIKEAKFSSPVSIIGFDKIPETGLPFVSVKNKKEAEKIAGKVNPSKPQNGNNGEKKELMIPLVIKADTAGSVQAIRKEIDKIKNPEGVGWIILNAEVGNIGENDVKLAGDGGIIIGFNVSTRNNILREADTAGVEIKTFDVIYHLIEWLEELSDKRKPKIEKEEILGEAKILKNFSNVGEKQVIGGKVISDKISVGDKIKIIRNGDEIGTDSILELQQQKADIKSVNEDSEFGTKIKSETSISPGDIIRAYKMSLK